MIVVKRTKDNSLWLKHILGDPALVATLAAVPDGSRHTFDIGGRVGVFVKMRDQRQGQTHGRLQARWRNQRVVATLEIRR